MAFCSLDSVTILAMCGLALSSMYKGRDHVAAIGGLLNERLQCFKALNICMTVRLCDPAGYAYPAYNGIRSNPVL